MNAEKKTYTLGVRILQLDEYDTEGSDVQVLIDEESEKTSEEDSISEAEPEEELKEPGPLIDQQIHLTLIAPSLKASPTDTKSNPLTSQTIMTTHTVTYASTAIASSEPALAALAIVAPPPNNYATNYNKSSEDMEEDQTVQEDQEDLINQTQLLPNNPCNQLQM